MKNLSPVHLKSNHKKSPIIGASLIIKNTSKIPPWPQLPFYSHIHP